MAIQQVGGAKVYVITGSNRDPRLTSTGQSWASLVSQQKYRLWQEAQRQALMDIKYDEMDYQQQVAIQDQLRKQLSNSIADTNTTIQKLRQKEVESRQAIQESITKEQNLRGRSKSITVGGGVGGRAGAVNPVDKQLALEIDRTRDNLLATKKYNDAIDEEIASLAGVGGATADINADRIFELGTKKIGEGALQNELDALIAKQVEREGMSEEEKRQEIASFGASTRRTVRTPDKPIVAPEPISYAEEIAQLEAERASLQEQLAGITPPTIERPDLIGRTRQVYAEKFAPGQAQPTTPPTRQAEMELLGMSTTPQPQEDIVFEPSTAQETPTVEGSPVRIAPEETQEPLLGDAYVKQFYLPEIKDLNNVGKAQKAMELIRDLEQSIPKTQKGYQETREAIIKAYQKQINPKAMKAIKDVRQNKVSIKEDGEYTKMINSLYSPTESTSDKDEQAMFDNAVAELQKIYKDDAKFEQAVKILIAKREEIK